MSKIRYYMDEHVSRAIIRGLRQRGVDVLTVPEAGLLGATDEQHLAFATERSRVMFTQDTDFLRLHAQNAIHAGIIYAPQRLPTGAIIQGLMLIVQVLEAEEIVGQVEYL